MKRLMLVLFTMLLPLTGMAEEMGADECVYNQEAFPHMLEQLRKQYAQSMYTTDKEAVEISLEDGIVTVSYGGCEHYGTEIRYIAKEKKAYSNKEIQ